MLIGSCEPDNDRYIALNLIECLNKTDGYIITTGDSSENVYQDDLSRPVIEVS